VDFLRLMPQKIPDYRAAQTFGLNAVCRVKNRLKADFWGFVREAQQTASALIRLKLRIYLKKFNHEPHKQTRTV
jgi:hypothetical protein